MKVSFACTILLLICELPYIQCSAYKLISMVNEHGEVWRITTMQVGTPTFEVVVADACCNMGSYTTAHDQD